MGERAIRFSPNGGVDYVDVCPLCADTAIEYGWVREGAPISLTVPAERRRRSGNWLQTLLGTRPRDVEQTVASEPILRRLSDQELAMVEAADLFNASQYRRTVGGIGKSLGEPRVSVVTLSGVNAEVVVTVAWDISWYQYRVSPESDNPGPARGAGPRSGAARGRVQELERAHGRGRPDHAGHRPGLAQSAVGGGARRARSYSEAVIFCVIPRELESDLFDKMVAYYRDNPNVTVIVDRRDGPDRRGATRTRPFREKRTIRDRRRARAAGTFLDTDAADG